MNKTAMLLLIAGSLTVPAVAAEADAKPTKSSIRAADGLSIVYEVRGKGDTSLVFLHGWCGDRQYWKNQVDAFAAEYRVVAIDQAGHGESGKNRERWTVNGLGEDVQRLVEALDLKRVILIGHSMGGPVSLVAAKRMPDRVVGVVGVDTLQNVEVKMRAEQVREFLARFETNFTGTVRDMYQGLLPETTDPKLKEWLISRAQAQDKTMAIALLRDMSAFDTKAVLEAAHVPVRCINSEGGYQFFMPTAIDVNRKYADYNAVFIQNVGHYPMLEKPAEFNEKLRTVLREFATKK